mmetsp:Transcript_6424/g.15572  ORF Transcript_6424/g.15572 Transcript_6424/m.15572 type:complete len:284 (+) Transcript_6424:765-1616(+)
MGCGGRLTRERLRMQLPRNHCRREGWALHMAGPHIPWHMRSHARSLTTGCEQGGPLWRHRRNYGQHARLCALGGAVSDTNRKMESILLAADRRWSRPCGVDPHLLVLLCLSGPLDSSLCQHCIQNPTGRRRGVVGRATGSHRQLCSSYGQCSTQGPNAGDTVLDVEDAGLGATRQPNPLCPVELLVLDKALARRDASSGSRRGLVWFCSRQSGASGHAGGGSACARFIRHPHPDSCCSRRGALPQLGGVHRTVVDHYRLHPLSHVALLQLACRATSPLRVAGI